MPWSNWQEHQLTLCTNCFISFGTKIVFLQIHNMTPVSLPKQSLTLRKEILVVADFRASKMTDSTSSASRAMDYADGIFPKKIVQHQPTVIHKNWAMLLLYCWMPCRLINSKTCKKSLFSLSQRTISCKDGFLKRKASTNETWHHAKHTIINILWSFTENV